MPAPGRVTALSGGRRRRAAPRPGAVLRPARQKTGAALDLAARVRTGQVALRTGIERRAALLDVIRAVNGSVDPERIAEHLVDLAATWVPAPCWAVVSADPSAELAILADRGFGTEMASAAYSVAEWVMRHDE